VELVVITAPSAQLCRSHLKVIDFSELAELVVITAPSAQLCRSHLKVFWIRLSVLVSKIMSSLLSVFRIALEQL